MMVCYNYEVLKYPLALPELVSSFKLYALFCTCKYTLMKEAATCKIDFASEGCCWSSSVLKFNILHSVLLGVNNPKNVNALPKNCFEKENNEEKVNLMKLPFFECGKPTALVKKCFRLKSKSVSEEVMVVFRPATVFLYFFLGREGGMADLGYPKPCTVVYHLNYCYSILPHVLLLLAIVSLVENFTGCEIQLPLVRLCQHTPQDMLQKLWLYRC